MVNRLVLNLRYSIGKRDHIDDSLSLTRTGPSILLNLTLGNIGAPVLFSDSETDELNDKYEEGKIDVRERMDIIPHGDAFEMGVVVSLPKETSFNVSSGKGKMLEDAYKRA